MAKQIQKEATRETKVVEESADAAAKDLQNVALAEDVDDLLAEIDGVLEENAEEFVRCYVQKGGQ